MSAPKAGDLRAGFIGLVVALIFLGAAMYGIVHLTNQKFASHAPAAGASH